MLDTGFCQSERKCVYRGETLLRCFRQGSQDDLLNCWTESGEDSTHWRRWRYIVLDSNLHERPIKGAISAQPFIDDNP